MSRRAGIEDQIFDQPPARFFAHAASGLLALDEAEPDDIALLAPSCDSDGDSEDSDGDSLDSLDAGDSDSESEGFGGNAMIFSFEVLPKSYHTSVRNEN